jgi:predicted amidohydrolase
MSGLGGLNKSPNGVVMGLVQLQLPVVVTPDDLARQTARIVELVGKARRNLAGMDLVVFPEYALHGLSMDTNPAIMCRMDGPEVAAFRRACIEHRIWGCFSIMEFNPEGNPYNVGLIIDDTGELRLYYRKLHPWVPVEPWEPGNLGIPVIDGPRGCKLALIICHDGMFPEMARECAYKGAEIMIRTAGYTAPIRHAWQITNQANAFQNLMITASVCMSGSDGSFDSMAHRSPPVAGVPTRLSAPSCAPTWFARRVPSGASRTIPISCGTAVMSPCAAAPRIAPIPSCATWSTAAIACPGMTPSFTVTVPAAALRRLSATTTVPYRPMRRGCRWASADHRSTDPGSSRSRSTPLDAARRRPRPSDGDRIVESLRPDPCRPLSLAL